MQKRRRPIGRTDRTRPEDGSSPFALYQLHCDGSIWLYVGTPFTGWEKIDDNPATQAIVGGGGLLYKLHGDGSIWNYVSRFNWNQIDDTRNRKAALVASYTDLYKMHGDGSIWHYDFTSDAGWQQLDDNVATRSIGIFWSEEQSTGLLEETLCKLHGDGTIWTYVAPDPLIPGWEQIDNDTGTTLINKYGGNLYKMRGDGSIFFLAVDNNWYQIDNNKAARSIDIGLNGICQMHGDGTIWSYVGPPMTGWQKIDDNPRAISIYGGVDGNLYQMHGDGSIWIYVGPPMTGWQQLDNNINTASICVAYRYHQPAVPPPHHAK